MIKLKWFVVFIVIELIVGGVSLYYWKYIRVLPNSPETYYLIFDKKQILDGNEQTAQEVIEKLDKRLDQYEKTFAAIAQTNDPKKLKALFYMNFVALYGSYGPRELRNYSFDEILHGSEYFQCGTLTTFLAMLLDRAGYEFKTVSVDSGNHGYLEVKFTGGWQILDPTINAWIDKSTEELLAGQPRVIKKFYQKENEISNERANQNLPLMMALKDQMFNQGIKENLKIDQYNYIDLNQYSY
ncbi:MAG: hypothetical protein HW405_740 [Candidatus Berkelbacteria bacterium]|nr:hypothetical protein [Candidatus Berkelbacteria bacterium]